MPESSSGQPSRQLTVVIVPLLGGEPLAACVRAFRAQGAAVLTVGGGQRGPDADPAVLETSETQVPRRRLLGLRAVETPFVGFVEDTCLPAAGWCDGVIRALSETDVAAVGGPIEVSRRLKPRFRALGFCEYARFGRTRMAGLGTGGRTAAGRAAVQTLPGANFAIRRAAVESYAAAAEGLVDNQLFEAVASGGGQMVMDEAMAATYAEAHEQGARLATRFHHGRIYGAGVSSGHGALRRLASGLAAGLAPAVLTLRTLRAAPGEIWRSPATLGWVVAMHAAWGLGEMLGKTTGRAGRSLEAWV